MSSTFNPRQILHPHNSHRAGAKSTLTITRCKALCGVFVVALLSGLSGCMYSPLTEHHVDSIIEPIHFNGAVLTADANVDIEYWSTLTHEWTTLKANIKPSPSSFVAHGIKWHTWSYKLNHTIWPFFWEDLGNGQMVARFRAIDHASGDPLYLFDSWELAPDVPLADFWQAHGSDQEEIRVFTESI
ncbi:hypothetical protein Enr13x_06780 [Stieleria neptunia]|uniref:Uncharacterized protein n=1 Tax=Stieleria neptunia TaxID=2527979 RepID=A0A518HJ33_9BACT|nr:hypothetical protein [Stieleria neptunia]QDV40842.1 hypothetical protein Enr13x_06780 [Stieleria neptunia]